MTYDATEYQAIVTVTDNEEGQLEADVEYNAEPIFINSYQAASDSVVIEADKKLEGQPLIKEQFAFELIDEKGQVLQTVKNNINGQIIFDEIAFEEAGTYEYIVREIIDDQAGIVYDQTEYQVVVIVTDDDEGQLIAQVEYVDGPVNFTNEYKSEDPEDPEKPGKGEPQAPTDPQEPDAPSSEPSDATEDAEESKASKLPTTGEAVTYASLAVILLLGGLALAYYSRKTMD